MQKMFIPVDPDAETTVFLKNGKNDTAILSHTCENNGVAFFFQNADLTIAKLVGTASNIAGVIRDMLAVGDFNVSLKLHSIERVVPTTIGDLRVGEFFIKNGLNYVQQVDSGFLVAYSINHRDWGVKEFTFMETTETRFSDINETVLKIEQGGRG